MPKMYTPYGPETLVFDLAKGFDDFRLSDAGELEIRTYFKHAIYISLGSSVLSLSKISLNPENESAAADSLDPKNAWVVKNILNDESLLLEDPKRVVIGDEMAHHGISDQGEVWNLASIIVGREYIIGRTVTPELGLADDVEHNHLGIRFGNMRGNLHLFDISEGGTTFVAVHPEDGACVNDTPTKLFLTNNPKTGTTYMPKVAADGKWTRFGGNT